MKTAIIMLITSALTLQLWSIASHLSTDARGILLGVLVGLTMIAFLMYWLVESRR